MKGLCLNECKNGGRVLWGWGLGVFFYFVVFFIGM